MIINEILSYKELCYQLGAKEVQGGEHRKRQLKNWNKIAEVEKVGRGKYVIKRLLTPEEIQEGEYSRNYSKFLQAKLIELFAKQKEIKTTYTYRQLREYLSMVNLHYFPVKYGKESIKLNAPCNLNLSDIFNIDDEINKGDLADKEKDWFHIADSHDKDALKYAVKALKNRGLLADYRFTYVFYKTKKDIFGNLIYSTPQVATDSQYAEIYQRNMEFLKANLGEKQIEDIERKAEGKEEKIYGMYQQAVFRQGEKIRKTYGDIPRQFGIENGFTGYAKAITILKPTRLENLIDSFMPKFNEAQVKEYLTSKRFEKIPYYLHEQLTEKLIKK